VKVSTGKTENRQVVLEVEADAAEVERSLEGAYHRLVKRAHIPGFRKGKAPRQMVERYLGRETLLQEALEQLVPQLLNQAMSEQGIEPIAQPEVEITRVDPVAFRATPNPPICGIFTQKSMRTSTASVPSAFIITSE